MGEFIGVDWASGTWVVVDFGGDPLVSTEHAILNVWQRFREEAETILVDIPIGLAKTGRRDCDIEARNEAGSRSSSVFTVPVEGAVTARNYREAHQANMDGGFNGLGSHSWGLVPRIQEVRVFLEEHPDAKNQIHESHPEVCFAKLAGPDSDLPPKKSPEGREQRLNLISGEAQEFGEDIESFVKDRLEDAAWHHKIQSGRVTDVIDAAGLALTAKLATERDFPHIPTNRPYDSPPLIIHP